MTRLIKFEIKIERCHGCPHLEFVDDGWASHHFNCKKLDLHSSSISDPESAKTVHKEMRIWFNKKCPFDKLDRRGNIWKREV